MLRFSHDAVTLAHTCAKCIAYLRVMCSVVLQTKRHVNSCVPILLLGVKKQGFGNFIIIRKHDVLLSAILHCRKLRFNSEEV